MNPRPQVISTWRVFFFFFVSRDNILYYKQRSTEVEHHLGIRSYKTMACVGGVSVSRSQCLLFTETKHSSLYFTASSLSCSRNRVGRRFGSIRAETMATEKLGIKIESNPPESKLTQLGVRKWPKYVPRSFPFSLLLDFFIKLC